MKTWRVRINRIEYQQAEVYELALGLMGETVEYNLELLVWRSARRSSFKFRYRNYNGQRSLSGDT